MIHKAHGLREYSAMQWPLEATTHTGYKPVSREPGIVVQKWTKPTGAYELIEAVFMRFRGYD